MIPHSRPLLGPEEEEAACRVIRSGQLAQGEEVRALEKELAQYLGVAHVVAVGSGSAALHLALLALDIGPGNSIAMPSYVCTALLNATQHTGATPILADIDPATFNLCPQDLSTRLQSDTRAILVPHMFGTPANLEALLALGIPIVEDCAMAPGATFQNQQLGTLGQLSIFSFYATKVICAGEGGAVATSNPELAHRLADLRDYDGRADAVPRFNYKLTDLQAALARVQLRRLDGFIQTRRSLGQRYNKAFSETRSQRPQYPPGAYPFRYVIRHPDGAEHLLPHFQAVGVAARRPVFSPLHRCLSLPDHHFPATTGAFHQALSLPLYPSLTEPEIERILRTAQEIL